MLGLAGFALKTGYVWAGAAAVAVCVAAAVFWPEQTEEHAAQATDSAPRQTVLGPGVLTGSQADSSLQARMADVGSGPPGGLAVLENQHLNVNVEFRNVLDYFLLERADGDRVNALRLYLQNKLPPPAYADALQVLEHYQAYMQAHDALLASQNLGTQHIDLHNLDAYRIASWKEQRDRLRSGMLGEPVAQAWYGEEDERLNLALAKLQGARNTAEPASDDNGVNGGPQRFAGRPGFSTEDMPEEELRAIIAKETTSYKALALETQQWVPRYQAFLGEVNQINQKPGLSAMERNQQVYELLLRKFPDKEERQRARDRLP
jgi:lipase chaperone LimK